ncbi:thioredoxin-like fold domain-containing protein MRL7, chloroplastic [Neltuma alba]|uniref:thioredoxin-like fold domain-containing protein MRL7, chloroplastic n=1 Tax=Neltuma alba TaxID=207710 RepID=UPI0010A3366C|nr:thioredoxin-like fold domain-containing protein MRL7, chloroplastic [Prosopis alba]XP_028765469.1 thioredoxin-like fold domain-containing protein MRL7, chloroplastic [Prosopis alba]
MLILQASALPRCLSPFCATERDPSFYLSSSFNIQDLSFDSTNVTSRLRLFLHSPVHFHRAMQSVPPSAASKIPVPEPEPEASSSSSPRAQRKTGSRKPKNEVPDVDDKSSAKFSLTIPRKPRRGRKSEAMAVEDFIRDSLGRTFASIQQQSSDVLENKENIMKERVSDESNSESSDDDDGEEEDDEVEEEDDASNGREKKMVIEEESKNWPLDADVGWGIRASDYFEQHPIKNVIGEDGVEIDWEGEIDDNWVQEINCLEWESYAFHPSPLVVLVFERYNRAMDNWKTLKELEKAIKVYWGAKDRLPPRAVKIDINIERDLAYALKARECPQILFLRGNRIVYREKEHRTADELVQMIAFFYYNAKKPSWIDDTALFLR